MANYQFHIRVKNPAGIQKAVITEFVSASCENKVNDYGMFAFSAPLSNSLLNALDYGDIVEFWWRNLPLGIDWRKEWVGIFYQETIEVTGDGAQLFTAICAGPEAILEEAYVAWPADTPDRSTFNGLPAESIMKALVSQNIGSNADTVNGRLLTNTEPNLSIKTDQGRGTIIARWSCAYKQVLQTCQELALIGGGDFFIDLADNGWQFEFCAGQKGRDLSSMIEFSLRRGNIVRPVSRVIRRGRPTIALVLGQGEGIARATTVVQSTQYNPINHREMIVDARNESDANGLGDLGMAKLMAAGEAVEFSYQVIQQESSHYGRDYNVGDLVTAITITGQKLVQKVTSSVLTVSSSDIRFDIQTNGQQPDTDAQLYSRFAQLKKRIQELEAGN